jgi:hypothetical protein
MPQCAPTQHNNEKKKKNQNLKILILSFTKEVSSLDRIRKSTKSYEKSEKLIKI